jgi:hypothetical protein
MQVAVSIADYDPNVNITEAAFDEFYVTNFDVSGLPSLNADLESYPNPCANDVTFMNLITNEPFVITDLMGKKLVMGMADNTKLTLDISAWNDGIYLFQQGQKTVRFIKGL